jgi:hypothetical protein
MQRLICAAALIINMYFLAISAWGAPPQPEAGVGKQVAEKACDLSYSQAK